MFGEELNLKKTQKMSENIVKNVEEVKKLGYFNYSKRNKSHIPTRNTRFLDLLNNLKGDFF